MLAAIGEIVDNASERRQSAVRLYLSRIDVFDGREVDGIAIDRNAMHQRTTRDDFLRVCTAVSVSISQHYDVTDRASRDEDGTVVRHSDHPRVDEVFREDG